MMGGLRGRRGRTEPGSGTSGRKDERDPEKGAGRRDEANRLPSPPPGRTTPGSFAPTPPPPAAAAHSLFIGSLPAPSPVK